MKQALDTRTKLLTKNPWPLMIELSIPAVLGMVVVGLYNMMDSIFVGQMVGDVQMGAISVSYPLTLINAGSAAMLGVGSASVLSRAIGKKDENTIKKIMGNLVAMVLLLSVIYTIVGMVFTRQLLSLTGASDNILNYAEKYLRIVFAGSLFVNFFQSANMVIRGEGQLKRAMTIIASGAILNIILDPIFISILNPYGMGIEAAAYATIFSQFVQAAITLWYFKKKSPHVKIGRIRIDGELLPQVLSVGISALLMQILTLVQQTVIYRVASNYGGETSQLLLAAALRFWNFSFVPLWGISQGFQPAAGTNYGAKDYDRVKTLTRVFIIAATLLSLVFYIPAELFPEKILSMFLTTPGIAASGSTNFRIMFSTYILQGSFMIAVTLFQSLGKAKKATWLVLFRQIILFIPLCVVLPMIGGMGIRGVWLRRKYPNLSNYRWHAIKLLEQDKEISARYPVNMPDVIDRNYESDIINEKYDFIEEIIREVLVNKDRQDALTEKVDRVLTHKFWSIPIFLVVMAAVFFLTFTIGDWLKGFLELGIESLSALISDGLIAVGVNEVLRSLLVDGIIAGVGGILTFLPNIFILFLALAFLEDSGYMARVAYVMEGIMSKLGLSGRAFIPMILGFGCTVPAIMASRSLENRRDRFKVMLITPFMSCSARLPIYILFAEIWYESAGRG